MSGLLATSWTAAHQASLSFHYVPEFAQTHVRWVDDGNNKILIAEDFV